jgi:hypothetical protein
MLQLQPLGFADYEELHNLIVASNMDHHDLFMEDDAKITRAPYNDGVHPVQVL